MLIGAYIPVFPRLRRLRSVCCALTRSTGTTIAVLGSSSFGEPHRHSQSSAVDPERYIMKPERKKNQLDLAALSLSPTLPFPFEQVSRAGECVHPPQSLRLPRRRSRGHDRRPEQSEPRHGGECRHVNTDRIDYHGYDTVLTVPIAMSPWHSLIEPLPSPRHRLFGCFLLSNSCRDSHETFHRVATSRSARSGSKHSGTSKVSSKPRPSPPLVGS